MNLPGSPLNARDLDMLAKCGINGELALKAMLRRVESLDGADLIGREHGVNYAGIVFPYMWPGEDHIREVRLRRDRPELEQKWDGSRKERNKYLSPPGRANLLYFVPGTDPGWLTDVTLPVLITEGEKKCLALSGLSWHGLEDASMRPRWLSIALSGVWNFRGTIGKTEGPNGERRAVKGVIPDFNRIIWKDRCVVIIFDANTATNGSVSAARRELAKELTRLGARVELIDLPEVDHNNGIDDLIGTWGHDRVLQLIQDTAKPWQPNYGSNDSGNADRLTDSYGHELIYCSDRKTYYVWTGERWELDEFVEAEKRAEQTIREAFGEATFITNDENRKAFFRFLNKSLSRAGLASMMHLAKKKVRQASANDFDRDPWMLNTENGTVDLRTGTLRPHKPEDLLNKLIRLRYDSVAQCPQFTAFLYRIMGSHPDASDGENAKAEQLVLYLQKVFGCAATGKPEKLLFVFYGEGNNGKTTLLEAIRDALGDKEYAGQVQVDSLMMRPKEALSNNAVNTDLADLQGCRFVSSSEVEQGQRLSLSRVKYLTGLGQIKARRLRENMTTFQPTYKLFLDCNHRPVITDPNDAIWNRVKCIPFKIQIAKAEIDTDLPAKLRTELPGILRWIVEGAVRYHREGLGEPPGVMAATEEYRQDSDRLKEFFQDCCFLAATGDASSWKKERCWVPVSALYPAYISWSANAGEKYPLAKGIFEERLKAMGRKLDRVRPDGGRDSEQIRVWLGIRLTASENYRNQRCDKNEPCDSV